MSLDLVASNLLNPPILFFFLGMLAVRLGSDLDIPQALAKLFSLYLLVAIGFRGGVELRASGVTSSVAATIGLAITLSLVVPLAAWWILRRRLSAADAAAVAATYGSVSAVTFLAATSLLDRVGVPYGGHMVAAMALMESPAIVVGVLLYRMSTRTDGTTIAWTQLLREAFLNGSVFVLAGSLVIGLLTGHEGEQRLDPFVNQIFSGVLCLFLLDMGLVSARRLSALRQLGVFPISFATLVPLASAAVAMALARVAGLDAGDAFLLTVLAAGASYIAVPASMRLAIPDANPGLYVTMALAITFPFNIAIGLPLYLGAVQMLWR